MIVYFISGLGADERVFKNLTLRSDIEVRHIPWPEHDPEEPLASYVSKFVPKIDTKQEFALVGFSFGGIVAIELAKLLSPKSLIIISSVSSRSQLPGYLKFIAAVKLLTIFPAFMMSKGTILSTLFNTIPDHSDRLLINSMIKNTNPYFIKWAIDKIGNWRNETPPEGLFHIHGNKDITFPISNILADKVVESGGHIMLLTHAKEVSDILNKRFGEAMVR